MYSFLVCAHAHMAEPSSLLDQACSITKTVMPHLGARIAARQRRIDEINGGWFYLFPEEDDKKHLVSEFADDALAILAFGEIFRTSADSAAQSVAKAWKSGGIDAVRNLEGCFSAVIIDLPLHTVYLVTDAIGTRSLRYCDNGELLLISPHDVPIAATGMCPIKFNLESAASIAALEWSLQGKPLLEEVNSCDAREYVTWREGTTKRIYKPLLTVEDRIDARDTESRDRQIDRIIDNIQENTRCCCGDEPVICTDLTAGLDSRTILGILLSVVDSSRLKGLTSGDVKSMEVKVARRLAQRYHFEHEYHQPDPPVAELFLAHSRLLAFGTNGDTSSKRAVHPLPTFSENPPLKLNGGAAEIFRGYYYPKFSDNQTIVNLTAPQVAKFLQKKLAYHLPLPWLCRTLPESVSARMAEIFAGYRRISPHGSDMLDMFYALERYGRWGSMVPRATWGPRHFAPFYSPVSAQLAFKLPAPISNDFLLHKTMMRRFLPGAYYWLLNDRGYLSWCGSSLVKGVIGKVGEGIEQACLRTRNALRLAKLAKSHERRRSEIFAGHLGETLRDMLLNESSIATSIFDKKGLQTIIDDHTAGKSNHLRLLGFLVTIEQWRQLIMETDALVRRASG